jgi:hypothetical protein
MGMQKMIEVWLDGKHITNVPKENELNVRRHYQLCGLERSLKIVDREKMAQAEKDREAILAKFSAPTPPKKKTTNK